MSAAGCPRVPPSGSGSQQTSPPQRRRLFDTSVFKPRRSEYLLISLKIISQIESVSRSRSAMFLQQPRRDK